MRGGKAPLAGAVIAGVTLLAAFNVMDIAELAVIGTVLVMVTRCVDPDEAFDAIDWRVLFLIFGMLGLSLGLERTGAAGWIVEYVIEVAARIGPHGILAGGYRFADFLRIGIPLNVLFAAIAVVLLPALFPI